MAEQKGGRGDFKDKRKEIMGRQGSTAPLSHLKDSQKKVIIIVMIKFRYVIFIVKEMISYYQGSNWS